jgi:hypothetical protein
MEETRLELAHVTVRKKNPWFAAAALLLLGPLPAVIVGVALTYGVLPLLGLAPLVMFGGAALWAADPAPRERLAQLAAGTLGLFVDGRRLAAREAVREAHLLLPRGDAPIVRIAAAGRAIELRVGSEEEGRRILFALGATGSPALRLGPRYLSDPVSAAQTALCAALFPLLCGAAGLSLGLHPLAFIALLLVAFGSAAFALVTLLAPTRVLLGEGGIEIAWIGRRRELAYHDLDSVHLGDESSGAGADRDRRVLSLRLRSGEIIRLAVEEESEGDAAAAVSWLEGTLSPRRLGDSYRALPAAT